MHECARTRDWSIQGILISFCVVAQMAACAPSQQEVGACAQSKFESDRFTTCTFDPSHQRASLAWADASGRALRSFAALETAGRGDNVAFAMNAGMFDAVGAPIGLYIENGVTRAPINLATGTGNFFLEPNGVFWIDGLGQAHVAETHVFQGAGTTALWASQSGPMLVVDGHLHPEISQDGPSRHIRNGVGEDCDGRVRFVISEDEVSLGKMARFFRDVLTCRNALYFDGAVSGLWEPALKRMDQRALMGPLVIIKRK